MTKGSFFHHFKSKEDLAIAAADYWSTETGALLAGAPYHQHATQQHGIDADWTARSLALHTQAVLQGAFILAKASGGATIAAESVDHLRRYVELLFAKHQEI